MKRIEALIPLVKPFYTAEDPAHDWPHIIRVIAMVRKLAEGESVNLPCLLAAAYCHDIVNLPKNHPLRSHASSMAAEKSAELMKQVGFTENEIINTKQFITEHSFSKGLRPSSLEAAIIQDADRLDTLGAIGILRCASVNTQMKSGFYELNDPLAKERELDDKKYMLDHYFVKIFKLPEMMNTPNAKIEANKRVEYMKGFLETLMGEIRN